MGAAGAVMRMQDGPEGPSYSIRICETDHLAAAKTSRSRDAASFGSEWRLLKICACVIEGAETGRSRTHLASRNMAACCVGTKSLARPGICAWHNVCLSRATL